ncbi:MAG: 2-succinyl-5-enolpyruvyl-6-hydroxy-3-cyclohexene-1-carboxylic-acid synthase [Myxococcota bacterium]
MSTASPSAFTADPSAVYSFIGQFFDSLTASGVANVVISPGSRSAPLSISADRTASLRTWIELDERSAAFFALGLAKATRQPVALICTSGTAAANYLPAIVEAHYSRVPLIVLTADRPPELRDWGAGQTIEQPNLYGRYSRWSVELPIPAAGDDALRVASGFASRAVEMASAVPAGAVHLNWPLREPLAPPVDRDRDRDRDDRVSVSKGLSAPRTASVMRFSHPRQVAEAADVRELVALVRSHERGVICCGPMDLDAEFARTIVEFADSAGWPVLADPASQLRQEQTGLDAPILDLADGFLRSESFASQKRPDVVLRIGEPPVSKVQRLWIEAAAPETVWWIDEGGQWGEPSQLATRVVRGGGDSLLSSATRELNDRADVASPTRRQSAWCQSFESLNEIARKAMTGVVCAEGAWSSLAVTSAAVRGMPAESVLFVSNSMSIRLLDLVYTLRPESLRVLCSRGASGIDGITSTALGVAAAGRPTLLLTGDLAFLHDLSGLLLTRHEPLPLSIVVLDDNGGGIFSFLPVAAQAESVGFERIFRTPHDLDLGRAAALFELDYHAVESIPQFASALDECLANPHVSIIHARFDAEKNQADFRDCVAQICDAVDASLGFGGEG